MSGKDQRKEKLRGSGFKVKTKDGQVFVPNKNYAVMDSGQVVSLHPKRANKKQRVKARRLAKAQAKHANNNSRQ
jgi:hypothetical protein